jgi:hypothetical protein
MCQLRIRTVEVDGRAMLATSLAVLLWGVQHGEHALLRCCPRGYRGEWRAVRGKRKQEREQEKPRHTLYTNRLYTNRLYMNFGGTHGHPSLNLRY